MARLVALVHKPGAWLVVLLAMLAAFRLAQAFSGQFQFADELRYLAAESFFDDVRAGAFREAAGQVFNAQGRPGFVLISAIPVSLQRAVESVFDIPRDSRQSYHVVSVFNVLVSLVIALTLYALARHWLASGWGGLTVTGVHALLTGSNMWIRHLNPYYESLCLMLVALLIVVRSRGAEAPRRGTAAWAGAMTALGYACYPGYYGFVLVIAAVLAWVSRRRMVDLLLFGSCLAAPLLLLEAASRWAGVSYFAHMAALSRTIHFGSSGENYVFFSHYLGVVEGPVGIALIVLLGAFSLRACIRSVTGEWSIPSSLKVAVAVGVLAYLIHANQSIRRYPTVFYGRLMLMYMPIVTLAAVAAVWRLRRIGLRRVAFAGLAVASVWSFVSFAGWFTRVRYPADLFFDVLAARGLGDDLLASALWTHIGTHRDHRLSDGRPMLALVADSCPAGFTTILASHSEASGRGARLIGVNLKWMRDVPKEIDPFIVPDGYRLVAQADNPAAIPALMFEDRGPIARARLRKRHGTMRIYEREDCRVAAGRLVAADAR